MNFLTMQVELLNIYNMYNTKEAIALNVSSKFRKKLIYLPSLEILRLAVNLEINFKECNPCLRESKECRVGGMLHCILHNLSF